MQYQGNPNKTISSLCADFFTNPTNQHYNTLSPSSLLYSPILLLCFLWEVWCFMGGRARAVGFFYGVIVVVLTAFSI